ncbi:ROK family protein, partial [Mycobacterium colombiense]|uniref:ROK family protein n=1 Tax=Mycobacterium colombiense TaxID=339268 RepID=UPI000ACE75C8
PCWNACWANGSPAAAAVARSLAPASVGAVCDLDLVVIGGGVAKSGSLLFDPLRAKLAEYAGLDFLSGLRVVPGQLGGTAGLIGAARLAGLS